VHVFYRRRALVALIIYASIGSVAYGLSYLLRFEFDVPPEYAAVFFTTLPVLVVIRTVCHVLFGVSNGRWRFTGTTDVLKLAGSNVSGTGMLWLLTIYASLTPSIPRSILIMDLALTTLLTAGVWIVYRTGFEQLRHYRSSNSNTRRVLIVGAGEAGSMLAREMQRMPTGYRAVGFIDDAPIKLSTTVHGVPVLGPTSKLPRIAAAVRADEIIIAVPSAAPSELRRIVEICEATELGVKVLPGIFEVLSGDVKLNQVRPIRIDDLLGRDPIHLELPELYEDLRGRSVMITGAAGSIGSELARQLALHDPGMLILVDQAETPLFYLELELRERFPNLNLAPVVGDVVDRVTVEHLFRAYSPSRVYHAAAYKHVPMMQLSAREAIRNNALGTLRLGEAAGRYEAEKFILVSTDKAVQPTSIMGASKRLAESVILELQKEFPDTTYVAVRFGNVLGSNGSVIPLFQQQIEAGKPITVTHPEATRYFMTIPEAVQLILQASMLPEVRGNIAMLEMGEPVRIVDLARTLLQLSGVPTHKQKIVFTGLRSGEKLHEELYDLDETTSETSIPKVKLVAPSDLSMRSVRNLLEEYELALEIGQDAEIAQTLATLFPRLQMRSRATSDLHRSVHAAPRERSASA
jgi:FlaA1/EpsC-like NDP-sugar epimerase